MRLHKEGNTIIVVTLIVLIAIGFFFGFILPTNIKQMVFPLMVLTLLVMFFLVVQFFRVPSRNAVFDNNKIIAPADGKIVAIEKIIENEYFNDERIQISIFMSPLNVHVNWYPVNGTVVYSKYHPGKYLVAWHPKSSFENERTTIVIRTETGKEVMVRQIAGAMARRICCYANENSIAQQGAELGFIKFGSRVDVIIPINAKVEAQLNQTTQGSLTCLAIF